MALSIEYVVNGTRSDTAAEVADAELRTAMEELADELREELADVTCPVHGEPPSLLLSESDGEITVGVESCCEKLEDIMEERFTSGDAGDE